MNESSSFASEAVAVLGAERIGLRLPVETDLDMLAGAFADFADDLHDRIAGDAEPDPETKTFGWLEVEADKFERAALMSAQAVRTLSPRLRAIWSPGRLAIVGQSGYLLSKDWADLIRALAGSQGGASAGKLPETWQAMDISGTEVAEAAHVCGLSDQPRHALLRAVDRSRPIQATPAQAAVLDLIAAQDEGLHPVTAMPPLILPDVNMAAIEAALEVVYERHEALHLSFVRARDAWFVRLDDRAGVPCSVHTLWKPLATLPVLAAERTDSLARMAFGPADRALWRCEVVQKGPDAALVAVFSETVMDADSTMALRDEILRLYDGFRAGDDPEAGAPPQPLQFADYIAARPVMAAQSSCCNDTVAPYETTVQTLHPYWPEGRDTPLHRQHALFVAFAQTLAQLLDAPEPVISLVRSEQRDAALSEVAGAFVHKVPVNLRTTNLFGQELRRFERALRESKWAGIAPARYLFEYRCDFGLPLYVAGYEDVVLRSFQMDGAIEVHWAVRKDHPLSRQMRKTHRQFRRNLWESLQI